MTIARDTAQVDTGHKYSVDASLVYQVEQGLSDEARQKITSACFKIQDDALFLRQDEIYWDEDTLQVDFIWDLQGLTLAESEKFVEDNLTNKVTPPPQLALMHPVQVIILGTYNDITQTWETEY